MAEKLLHFVTSKMLDADGQPKDHVTSLNERRKTAGIVGPETYLLPVRGKMECSMVDSNTLRIMGGDAITCGGHWEVKGSYIDLTIENGTPGMKRIDLAVARLTASPQEGIMPVVIKGDEVAENPAVPGHVVGDLNDGDTVTEVPICSVLIDGINPQEPVNLIQQHLLVPLAACPYAVGDIYITARSDNPSAIWSGTSWERISDRFLLAAGANHALGSTGGEEAHALTIAELAAHAHTVTGTAASGGAHTHPVVLKFGYNGSGSSHLSALATQASAQTVTDHQDVRASSAGAHVHTVSGTAASAGSGTAHNNMPPYLAVNIWKRTA